jgi:hypothetical protein
MPRFFIGAVAGCIGIIALITCGLFLVAQFEDSLLLAFGCAAAGAGLIFMCVRMTKANSSPGRIEFDATARRE